MRKPLLVSVMTPEELEALRERQTARAAAELEAAREKHRKRSRDYARAHPEASLARCRNWYAKNTTKRREYKRKENYGITQTEWDALFTSQGNCCGNCRSTDPGTKTHWHTDHDHVSGEVRGILCAHCNRMVGAAKDDIDILLQAVEYLKNPPARKILKCENV